MLGLERLEFGREDYETKYMIMGPLKKPTRYMSFLFCDWIIKCQWNFITLLKIYEMATGKYYNSYTIIYSVFIFLFYIGHIFSGIVLFPLTVANTPPDFKHISTCTRRPRCLKFLTWFKLIFLLFPVVVLDMFHIFYILFSGCGFFNSKDRQKSQIRFYDIKTYQ